MIQLLCRAGRAALRFGRGVISALTPSPRWQPIALILSAIFVGLLLFIYHISNASSYLSKDPKTCINCHVMVPQYASWKRSSHVRVANCVDCHVPHDNIFNTYKFKIKDGTRHATIFTLRTEPQVIRIKEEGAAVVQENCIRCHENVLRDVSAYHVSYAGAQAGEGKLCWDCHREVPHGRVRSLSTAPYALIPETPGGAPEWMKKFLPVLKKNSP